MKTIISFCLLALATGAAADEAPAIRKAYNPQALTDGVYVIHGPLELPNPENQGFINNPGFVVTAKGVVVIDPGSSVQVGRMVLEKIAAVTTAPVVAVFNTHIHGDHWLGNQAIKAAFPKAIIYAHPRMIEKTAGAGPEWVERFNRLTDGAVAGTKPVAPDLEIDDGETVKIGGLSFRIHHPGKAHTDGDIMVEVVERKVLFLGDNAFYGRIGRMDDGDFKGNIAALTAALDTKADYFVPGHGRAGGREVAAAYRDYLSTVYAQVEALYAEGIPDYLMKPKIEPRLARFRDWAGFDDELGRHIHFAYRQVEVAAFF